MRDKVYGKYKNCKDISGITLLALIITIILLLIVSGVTLNVAIRR